MKSRHTLIFPFVFILTQAFSQSTQVSLDVYKRDQFKSNDGVSIREDYIVFDGKSGILEFNSAYQPEGSFSISLWVKPVLEKRAQTIIAKGELCPDGNPNYKGFTFLLGLSQEMNVIGSVIAGEGNQLTGSLNFKSLSAIIPDKWQHVAFVFDAEQLVCSIYVDGQEVPIDQSFQPSRSAFKRIAPSPTALWVVGAKESYCNYIHSFDEYFNGSLKRIYIYDYKLSMDQITSESNLERNRVYFILGGAIVLFILIILGLRFLRRRKITEVNP